MGPKGCWYRMKRASREPALKHSEISITKKNRIPISFGRLRLFPLISTIKKELMIHTERFD